MGLVIQKVKMPPEHWSRLEDLRQRAFKKAILPVTYLHPVEGHIRNVEFFHRQGVWYAAICYDTPAAAPIRAQGCIGVDRNSVGNIAVLADPQSGKVRVLGLCAASSKYNFRRRKARLLAQGRRRQVSRLRRKQARRATYENHRTSKAIVAYAQAHCRAIAIENLKGVSAEGSKIKGYTQKSQWAFGQLETFLRYKACLAGVLLIEVDPAYSSQTCSRCGEPHKPTRKLFECPSCQVKQHRDANSGFVIAQRGNQILSGAGAGVDRARIPACIAMRSIAGRATLMRCGLGNAAPAGPVGGPLSGKEVVHAG